eukprot:SAG31_NODE_1384_length_8578_cov_2.883359_1_plen_81_part_10
MDEASITAGFKRAVEISGKIDILINNGLSVPDGGAGDVTNTTFAKFAEHQHNNAGYFVLARELRDHLVQRGCKVRCFEIS